MKKRNIKKITGLTAISTAMGASVNAALVPSITIPAGGLVPPSTLETINWDIDIDGTNDFSFSKRTISSSINSVYYTTARMQDLGDARVAGGFEKLSSGDKLGTALDGLSFSPTLQNRALISSYSGTISVGGSLSAGGWSVGDTGYFGFKFTISGNTHYGWAEMTLSSSSLQATINEAWYNDTPDGAVTVGVIPEPAEFGLGLGALALGAVGLRRMRHNRKAA
jgi:hypothetical protein